MNRILNYARDLNRKVGSTLSSEKAKKIRKNLILWGAVLTLISAIALGFGIYKMFGGILDKADDSIFSSESNCPEMGEEGWFECESEHDRKEMDKSFSNVASGMFTGFGIVSVSAIILAIGATMIRAGLIIVIGDVGSKFLDTAPKCPNCGDPIEENEVYCNKCGADIRNKTKCVSCGTQNDVGDAFCRKCGKKLDK